MFAQNVAYMEFKSNIKDQKNTTSNLVVFDGRTNKSFGKLNIEGVATEIKFKGDIAKDYAEWFKKYNKKGGINDIALLVEKMEIEQDSADAKSYHVYFEGSTFYKRNENYFFITRLLAKEKVKIWDITPSPKKIVVAYDKMATQLLLNSYGKMAISRPIKEEQLVNYEETLKSSLPSLSLKIKDGVYKDYMSYINQRPCSAEIKLDSKGNIKGITEGGLKANHMDYYIVVHNGEAYKTISPGFRKIMLNDEGVYIMAYQSEIVDDGASVVMGGIAGGLVGAVLVAAINKMGDDGLQKFYIDLLTGEYKAN